MHIWHGLNEDPAVYQFARRQARPVLVPAGRIPAMINGIRFRRRDRLSLQSAKPSWKHGGVNDLLLLTLDNSSVVALGDRLVAGQAVSEQLRIPSLSNLRQVTRFIKEFIKGKDRSVPDRDDRALQV